MVLAIPFGAWISVALPVVLIPLAAKAHGRQVRLERELRGFREVSFAGANDPWVEALWRRDRRAFALGFAALLALGVGLTLAGALPLPFAAGPAGPVEGVLGAVAWAFLGGFLVAGGWSLAAYLRAARGAPAQAGPARASVGWWALTWAPVALHWALAVL